mmetsp:Transcript_84730/g.181547  ORF Transcript_84730/g.181547 Transcript_84730/m.181547 type:complete len:248 (-) Transcript_84730:36-779(-)
MMYAIDFRLPQLSTMRRNRLEACGSSIGNFKTGVRMLLAREALGSSGTTGRGSARSMNALHSIGPSLCISGSFKVSALYLRKAPASAAMSASLTVQPCFSFTTFTRLIGTGGMAVKTCRPEKGKKGLRSAKLAFIRSSASGLMISKDKMPRMNMITLLKTPMRRSQTLRQQLFLGLFVLGSLGCGRFPNRMAGSGILSKISPPSHSMSGRVEKSRPRPSVIAWWIRTAIAERPVFALRMVTVQRGRS